jgi:hypothetical protein
MVVPSIFIGFGQGHITKGHARQPGDGGTYLC